MNPTSTQALLQAKALLPKQKQHNFGKLICVLAFVKAWSASCCNRTPQEPGDLSAKPDAAMAAAHTIPKF